MRRLFGQDDELWRVAGVGEIEFDSVYGKEVIVANVS